MTEQAVILPLQAGNMSLLLAGGKGANLARLVMAGFPVPGGFLITTHAYHSYVVANALQNWVLGIARSAPADDPSALEEASRAIRARLEAGILSPTLAQAIRDAYVSMGQPLVAVRSSA